MANEQQGVIATLMEKLGQFIPASARQFSIHGRPAVLIPNGIRVESDFDHLADRPQRIEAAPNLHGLDDFLAYYNLYANANSRIFADRTSGKMLAILDYHEATSTVPGENKPRWGVHKVTYTMPPTESLMAWKQQNGQWQTQEAFATHLEDNINDILSPKGAQLLTLALRFKAMKSVKFDRSTNLQNGDVQLTFIEETSARGNIEVPESFKIGIVPFENSKSAYELEAKLRYRISEAGALSLMYRLPKLKVTIDEAFNDIVTVVRKGAKKGSVLLGTP